MKLGEIFCDGMIFQANKPIRIFGNGKGHASAKFLGETGSVDSDGGRWVIELKPRPYGGPFELEVELDGQTTVIHDVMIGEVVLFSGQSNIQFRMEEEITPPEDYADDENLRIFVSERIEQGEPLTPADGWVKCRRENIPKWSAVAYLTGCEARNAGVPTVGVVVCSQGASVIQSWIDDRVFVGSALELPDEKLHRDSTSPNYSRWNAPGRLYHFMLERLMPYSFGNVVWYQGESNTSPDEGRIYTELLAMMIENWRKEFRDDHLPFTVVQISDFTDTEGWRLVQSAQLAAEDAIADVVCVKSADVCEKKMIHPVTKGPLAVRIFAAMRGKHTI